MTRALILVLDSVGIGGAADAEAFGDEGANTLGHIAEACAAGSGDRPGLRSGPLLIPNLVRLGLGRAAIVSAGRSIDGLDGDVEPAGLWGYASEVSKGKDTPSGHWEIAGVPVPFDWGYFPETVPTFPAALTDALIAQADIPGILGNRHASGTVIIEELGEAHVRTGMPICYTSADSVLQIAAHEEAFGLDRLYAVCAVARRLVDPLNIGRVIARPFIGNDAASFRRTANRRDYATPPPEPTLCDRLVEAGRDVVGIGKIGDIFAHRGISREIKAPDDDGLVSATVAELERLSKGSLIFTNLVEFDSLYGHRRDVPGYAAALEAFDRRLPEIEAAARDGDLVVITADHGNDPTWTGTDHTRENIPVLAFGPGIGPGTIGHRKSFADIGAAVAVHLGLDPGPHGSSFL